MKFKQAEKVIKNLIKNSSNVLDDVVEYLHNNFDNYNWVGIYIVKGNDLILGPWRGKEATEHIKIPVGKGICGSAAASGKIEIVPDVKADQRYLSCFISTKSEIVVPIKKGKKTLGEIDIDSDKKDAFSNEDKIFLERIADMLSKHIH